MMEEQKQAWNLIQKEIASRVQVYCDPPVDNTVIAHNPLFHLVRDDDHHKPELNYHHYYGGVDVSFPQNDSSDDTPKNNYEAVAVYVIVDKRSMKVIYRDCEYFELNVPYISGYLAFREIDPLARLVSRQAETNPEVTPRAILVDGNGIWHPRHAGLACFLGTQTGIPTIGIGKTLPKAGGWTMETVNHSLDLFLKGVHYEIEQNNRDVLKPPLQQYRGLLIQIMDGKGENQTPSHGNDASNNNNSGRSTTAERQRILDYLAPFCNGLALPMINSDDSIGDEKSIYSPMLGCALVGHGGKITRASSSSHKNNKPASRGASKPIFVSVGHKMSLQEAVRVTASLSLCQIPEPVRQADLIGRELMRKRSGKT